MAHTVMNDRQGVPHDSEDAIDQKSKWPAIAIGNFIEWFDFAIYGYFAATIGQLFFPAAAPGLSTISAFAVFAVGFVSRPLGALIFGPIGDRYGRRVALAFTIAGMGVVTTLIGILPTYGQIGIAAPILLTILRFTQGIFVGGEWSSAGIYAVESAPAHRRAFAASLIAGTAGLAFLAGIGIAGVLTWTLSAEALASWGWRLPFVCPIGLAFLGLHIRRDLDETRVFITVQQRRLDRQIKSLKIGDKVCALLVSFAMSALFGVSLYYLVVYSLSHMIQTVGLEKSHAMAFCAVALLVSVIATPFIGLLSDKVGRRSLVLIAAGGILLWSYPLFVMLNTGNSALILLALSGLSLFVSIACVMNVVLLVEVFPASIRASYAAIGYNAASALLAGPSPLIAASLAQFTGDPNAPAWYMAAVSIVCFAVLWKFLGETKGCDITQG